MASFIPFAFLSRSPFGVQASARRVEGIGSRSPDQGIARLGSPPESTGKGRRSGVVVLIGALLLVSGGGCKDDPAQPRPSNRSPAELIAEYRDSINSQDHARYMATLTPDFSTALSADHAAVMVWLDDRFWSQRDTTTVVSFEVQDFSPASEGQVLVTIRSIVTTVYQGQAGTRADIQFTAVVVPAADVYYVLQLRSDPPVQ